MAFPTSDAQLLTTGEAAERLRLPKSALDKLRLTAGGPRFVRLGARVRYRPVDLDDWVASNLARSTSEARRRNA